MSKVHETRTADGRHYSWVFVCPACRAVHQCDGRWKFNGNVDRPTFHGSVLVYGEPSIGRPRCHSFVIDGRISFCADSEHSLAGRTVDIPDWDESRGLGGAEG